MGWFGNFAQGMGRVASDINAGQNELAQRQYMQQQLAQQQQQLQMEQSRQKLSEIQANLQQQQFQQQMALNKEAEGVRADPLGSFQKAFGRSPANDEELSNYLFTVGYGFNPQQPRQPTGGKMMTVRGPTSTGFKNVMVHNDGSSTDVTDENGNLVAAQDPNIKGQTQMVMPFIRQITQTSTDRYRKQIDQLYGGLDSKTKNAIDIDNEFVEANANEKMARTNIEKIDTALLNNRDLAAVALPGIGAILFGSGKELSPEQRQMLEQAKQDLWNKIPGYSDQRAEAIRRHTPAGTTIPSYAPPPILAQVMQGLAQGQDISAYIPELMREYGGTGTSTETAPAGAAPATTTSAETPSGTEQPSPSTQPAPSTPAPPTKGAAGPPPPPEGFVVTKKRPNMMTPPGLRPPVAPIAIPPGLSRSADDPRGLIPTIRYYANLYEVPGGADAAVAVARNEGLKHFMGDEGSSGGAFQFHRGGISKNYPHKGLGDKYYEQTGRDPFDPNNEIDVIKWAMRWASLNGWSDFSGAKGVPGTGVK